MQLSYGMNDYEAKTIQIDSKRECQLPLGIHITFHFHLISNTNHG